jgi:quinone-modifying oxidoreductase, subunit QmoC
MRLDPTLHRKVGRFGNVDVDACYNCGNCTATCNLSDEDHSFPRRMMHYLQIGNREKLVGSLDPWLCHNCGDCSVQCPREANPSEIVGAVRAEAVKSFAFPSFMGRMVASPKWLPVLFLIPLAIFVFFALGLRGIAKVVPVPEFSNVFPELPLEIFFFTLSALVILSFAVGVAKFIRSAGNSVKKSNLFKGLVPAVKEILQNKRFTKCEEERYRFWGHLLTLSGFLTLFIVSSLEGIGTWFHVVTLPLPFWNSHEIFASILKISANVGGLVLLAGLVILLVNRFRDPEKRANSSYFDWLLPWLLVAIVLTGFLSQGTRLAGLGHIMFGVYFVHLTLIFMLFAYMPFSKFAHVVYRTVAMSLARKSKA